MIIGSGETQKELLRSRVSALLWHFAVAAEAEQISKCWILASPSHWRTDEPGSANEPEIPAKIFLRRFSKALARTSVSPGLPTGLRGRAEHHFDSRCGGKCDRLPALRLSLSDLTSNVIVTGPPRSAPDATLDPSAGIAHVGPDLPQLGSTRGMTGLPCLFRKCADKRSTADSSKPHACGQAATLPDSPILNSTSAQNGWRY